MDEHVERLSGLYDELLEQPEGRGGRCGDSPAPDGVPNAVRG